MRHLQAFFQQPFNTNTTTVKIIIIILWKKKVNEGALLLSLSLYYYYIYNSIRAFCIVFFCVSSFSLFDSFTIVLQL